MQFKRPRLSVAHPFVNASLGLALLLSAGACSRGGDEAPVEANTATVIDPLSVDGEITLPAVLSTRALKGEVASMALSGGMNGTLAIAYESGGLQLFNMMGDRLGEPASLSIEALAPGYGVNVDGAELTVFPGVDRAGTLKALVFGEGLVAPAQVDLPINEERRVGGVCTGPAPAGSVMRLAYWTQLDARTLKTGLVGTEGGEFTWTPEATTPVAFLTTSCVFQGGELIASDAVIDAVHLDRDGASGVLSLSGDGDLRLTTNGGLTTNAVAIRDGLTISAPDAPDALAALGQALNGNYPGGVAVIAGDMGDGEHQAVFVDLGDLDSALGE